MPEQPANLRPYGVLRFGSLERPAWPPEYKVAALARARFKRSLTDPDAPLRRDSRLALRFAVALLLSVLFAVAHSALINNLHTETPAAFWLGFIVLLCARPFMRWWESDGHSPKGAVRAWARSVQAGRWERAHRLSASADKDDFPRIVPGAGVGGPVAMTTPADVLRYWTELRSCNRISRSQWLVSKAKVRPLAPDLAVVQFRLSVARSYVRFALLLVFMLCLAVVSVGAFVSDESADLPVSVFAEIALMVLLIAALLLLSRRRHFELSKLVVASNGRWRIFNGEWQGPEERDLSWLRAHA